MLEIKNIFLVLLKLSTNKRIIINFDFYLMNLELFDYKQVDINKLEKL